MWSLKFRIHNKDSIYTALTEKYKVTDYFYPVDRFKKKGMIYILGIHFLEGDNREKNGFARDVKKNKKVIEFERNGENIVILIKEEEKFYELLYNPELYLPSPVIAKDGLETWHVCSWKRNLLESVFPELEKWKNKIQNLELLELKKTKLTEIYFPKIIPKLPAQQHLSFQTAVKHGYYSSPRKADLKDMAKKLGISVSTFQEHLRKAEEKLMPFLAKNFCL